MIRDLYQLTFDGRAIYAVESATCLYTYVNMSLCCPELQECLYASLPLKPAVQCCKSVSTASKSKPAPHCCKSVSTVTPCPSLLQERLYSDSMPLTETCSSVLHHRYIYSCTSASLRPCHVLCLLRPAAALCWRSACILWKEYIQRLEDM